MAASRSTDSSLGSVPAALRGLGRTERLAALGAIVAIASILLPWYRVERAPDLVETGIGAFGFAEAALLLTLGSALALLFLVGRGQRPPLPLHEGTLLAAAGLWSALIVLYLMIDRPDFRFAGFESDYSLAYGAFVALGGSAVLALAGIRIRREELARERAGRPKDSG